MQRRGFGSKALRAMLNRTRLEQVATVTRNPATVKLVGTNFRMVSPDLGATRPLHRADDARIAALTEEYAQHIGARGPLPVVTGRYESSGLYGGEDPGRRMPIPAVAQDARNAVIVAGMERI
jgi:hypothetical protein